MTHAKGFLISTPIYLHDVCETEHLIISCLFIFFPALEHILAELLKPNKSFHHYLEMQPYNLSERRRCLQCDYMTMCDVSTLTGNLVECLIAFLKIAFFSEQQ